eukprot:2406604-Pyramimonas_sp.AAC.1
MAHRGVGLVAVGDGVVALDQALGVVDHLSTKSGDTAGNLQAGKLADGGTREPVHTIGRHLRSGS